MNNEQLKAIADLLKGAALAQLVGFGYDGIQKRNFLEAFGSLAVFLILGLVVILILGTLENNGGQNDT